jgi:hypothetical protein
VCPLAVLLSARSSGPSRTATTILANVKSALAAHSASKVTVVGHSLGAAISLLDGLYLSLNLPTSVAMKFVGYGMPRVGNQAFASLLDSSRVSITHINNKLDPVPILPGMFLNFHHPAGEVHIQSSGAWDACPGDDNPSTLCIVGDEPTILTSNTVRAPLALAVWHRANLRAGGPRGAIQRHRDGLLRCGSWRARNCLLLIWVAICLACWFGDVVAMDATTRNIPLFCCI